MVQVYGVVRPFSAIAVPSRSCFVCHRSVLGLSKWHGASGLGASATLEESLIIIMLPRLNQY